MRPYGGNVLRLRREIGVNPYPILCRPYGAMMEYTYGAREDTPRGYRAIPIRGDGLSLQKYDVVGVHLDGGH